MIKAKMQCPICNAILNNPKTLELKCNLTGDHIVRQQCSNCDVIFGDMKLINMNRDQLALEYKKLFDTGYRDINSTGNELELFKRLNPKKEGVYLNWGAGSMSDTAEILKKQGYTLLCYDLYNPMCAGRPNFIYDVDNLKVDGIISNDLIEHLQDPVADLKKMKLLLKNKDCKMIHATDCYRYVIEWSKYHLYFFVGKSVDFMCQVVGLNYSRTDNQNVVIYSIK